MASKLVAMASNPENHQDSDGSRLGVVFQAQRRTSTLPLQMAIDRLVWKHDLWTVCAARCAEKCNAHLSEEGCRGLDRYRHPTNSSCHTGDGRLLQESVHLEQTTSSESKSVPQIILKGPVN